MSAVAILPVLASYEVSPRQVYSPETRVPVTSVFPGHCGSVPGWFPAVTIHFPRPTDTPTSPVWPNVISACGDSDPETPNWSQVTSPSPMLA